MDQNKDILENTSREELAEMKELILSVLRKVHKISESEFVRKLPGTYTLDEVAYILHITKKGLRKKIEKGEINYIPGRVPLITEQQLYRYLKQQQPNLKRDDVF